MPVQKIDDAGTADRAGSQGDIIYTTPFNVWLLVLAGAGTGIPLVSTQFDEFVNWPKWMKQEIG